MTNTSNVSPNNSKPSNDKQSNSKPQKLDVQAQAEQAEIDAQIQAEIDAEIHHQASSLATDLLSGLGSSNKTASETDAEVKAVDATKFSDFALPQPLLKALKGLGFVSPTPVQEDTLEAGLEGSDLMVSAQTGSGKTVAFLLPCLTHILANPATGGQPKVASPQVLVICPTRELVQQVSQDAIKLVKHCKGLRIASIMGGMPYHKQISGLRGAQVVIATPGRLLDLQERNNIRLDQVTHMVLDEADRMLDLGFSEDLAKIAKLCDNREQTLLFSATFAKNIVGLAQKLMHQPQRIDLANSQDKHADITQSLFWADNEEHKEALLMYWLKNEPIDQAVIFAPTQVETERLAKALRKADFSVVDLHGGMRQFMRMKQIKKLRDGKAQILVATDVAARGLDVPSISHVINYGIPMKNEDYVHRIGRTGRAGRAGHAITVATHSDRRKVFALQHFLKQDIDVLEVDGMEPKPYNPRDKKRANSRGRGRNNGGGYQGKRNGGGYQGKKSASGYQGKRSSGGYQGKKDGDGYQGKRDGGYKGKRNDSGYQGKKEDGGYKGKRNSGGYQGKKDAKKNDNGYQGKKNNRNRNQKNGTREQVFGKNKPKKWED